MNARSYVFRLLAGLAIMTALLAALFALTLPLIHRWGATDAEVSEALPGDDLLPQPQLTWTNAIDIGAPPTQVWPWLAQLGDTRGGFYSFTFIENRVGALTGASSYDVVYRNANQIVPEWQQPAAGDSLIQGTLDTKAVQSGEWLLGSTGPSAPFGWTWVWRVSPREDGSSTRLMVRMRIQTPGDTNNPVMGLLMDTGGFVMEQRMLHGIKLRAEGGVEPAWAESAEIALWFGALLCGLVAAVLFVLKPRWQRPLALAVVAVIALFVLTFVQPPLLLRLLIDLLLAGGVWWAAQTGAVRRVAQPRLATT